MKKQEPKQEDKENIKVEEKPKYQVLTKEDLFGPSLD